MPTITAIEVQKKNPNRVNIYLDGDFAFGLARIVAVWLKTGQVVSDEKLSALREEDAREVAMQKALHYLSYRPRSMDEVRKNLQKHEIPESVIDLTLEKLERNGLIGDETFARTWVENRSTFRPRSKKALRIELRQKGLADSTIQNVLDEMVEEEPLALEAARKYARRLHGLDRLVFKQKLGAYLARRGFGYDVIAPIVTQVWQETHPEGGF